MIILFGNQKGGCGKTTNCIQFANYLVEKGKEVLVLDLDFQRSLSDRRKEDIATYDNEPKYDLRDWSPNHEKMGKGVRLSNDELKTLKDALNRINL